MFLASERTNNSLLTNVANNDVTQPSSGESGYVNQNNKVGIVKRYKPFLEQPATNSVDVSIFTLNESDINVSTAYQQLGLTGWTQPMVFATQNEILNLVINNTPLYSSGRTTGAKGEGETKLIPYAIGLTTNVTGNNNQGVPTTVTFTDCIRFIASGSTTPTGYSCIYPIAPGDSGSVLIGEFDGIRKIVGLNFAGNDFNGFANYITNVQSLMNISPYTGQTVNYSDINNIQYHYVSGKSSDVSLIISDNKFWQVGLSDGTPTPTDTPTPTPTNTETGTSTPTPTNTETPTQTQTPTTTTTSTPTQTPTTTSTPTVTPTNTNTPTPTSTPAPVTTNLRLYYDPSNPSSYSGTGTTINDLSGNGLNGSMSGITFTTPYFSYNGTSSQIRVADNVLLEPGSGDWTMEVWVNQAVSGNDIVLAKVDNGGDVTDMSYSIRTTNTTYYAQLGSGSGSGPTLFVNSTNYVGTLNTWYQIVYVFTNVAANTLQTFVNGVSIGTVSHNLPSILNSTNPLYIGSYNGGEYVQWFDGKIGITRLYNASLTSSQVLQNFNADKSKYGL
jgi:cell division septation protein DedD